MIAAPGRHLRSERNFKKTLSLRFGLLPVVYIFTANALVYIDAAWLCCKANSQSPASSQHAAVTYDHMDDVKPTDCGFYSLLFSGFNFV